MGANGFFNDQVSDAEMVTICKNLQMLRRDSLVDYTTVLQGHVAIEIIRLVRRLTGDDFAQWMRVNADGPLAGLVRDTLNYINGKIGHLSMKTSVTMHEERLRNVNREHLATYTPLGREGSSLDPMLKNGLSLFNFDLYRLLSGIGPVEVGRMFLLLGGDTYYAG